jgi:3-oxoacyl-[acyl-carrier protein] reductase
MEMSLDSKVALVTGSSAGLGLEIARTLYQEGCFVLLNGTHNAKLNEALSPFKKRGGSMHGDVTSPQICTEIIKKIEMQYGRLDILVCNVGNGSSTQPGKETRDEWRRMFDLNFFSATNIIEAAQPLMEKTGGSIVCVSSICGSEILGAPLTYSCAKAALNHYVRGIARPLAKKNIRINAVAPGNMLFEGSTWEKKLAQNEEAVADMLNKEVSLARFGKPEEISNLIAFLCSPLSAFTTGAHFIVDGGQVRS